MADFIQVITTTETEEEARKIAEYLVREHLAACAQVSGPITSFFWWEGKFESCREWQVRAKTLKERYGEVEAAIKQLHSYSVPQIIAIEVVDILEEYGDWIRQSVSS